MFTVQNEPGSNTDLPSNAQVPSIPPPGDIGAIAQYIHSFAHYPDPVVSLSGAIAIYAGIAGRAYNAPSGGSGLNVYILLLAPTGVGKDIVKKARSSLFRAIGKTVPSIEDFKGPGDLGSPQGLIRWLEKRPCCASIFSEFGATLKRITNHKASSNDAGIARMVVDAYSSGYDAAIDPVAYSDREKNTATIYGASYSIFAESVPETIYENFSEGLISSGLLPRFDVWESNNPRPYIKQDRIAEPHPALVQRLADLAAYCQTQSQLGNVIVPTFGPGAEAKLYEFEAWATDAINASNEVARQLWNRAYLKALKLATLYAVGVNYIAPVVTLDAVMWATNLVAAQTLNLIGKFANGEVGEEAGNQTKQQAEVIRVIREYVTRPWSECKKYHGDEAFHKHGVITFAHIQQRLQATSAFRNDRLGPREALIRTVKFLLESDIIRELPVKQMVETYGKHPRSFAVSDPKVILNGLKRQGF